MSLYFPSYCCIVVYDKLTKACLRQFENETDCKEYTGGDSLVFSLSTEKQPVIDTKAICVGIQTERCRTEVHPDLCDYQRT